MIWVAIVAGPAIFAVGYITGRVVLAWQLYKFITHKGNQCSSNE